jgi:hypothetical protein
MPSILNGISIDNTMTASQLSQYFRSFLIRLGLLESYLGVIPTDWDPTFAIVLEMKDGEAPEEPLTKVIFTLGDMSVANSGTAQSEGQASGSLGSSSTSEHNRGNYSRSGEPYNQSC